MEGSFFKVGEFEVDPRTNQIYRKGTATVLPPRLMDLLCFFASRADEVVTRKEIVDNCWNRTFVTDQVVTQSIFELRKYLRGGRPKAEAADYIRTVPKRGYQLVASVAVLPTAAVAEFAAANGVESPATASPAGTDVASAQMTTAMPEAEPMLPPVKTKVPAEKETVSKAELPKEVGAEVSVQQEESAGKHFLKSLWLNLSSLGFKKGAY